MKSIKVAQMDRDLEIQMFEFHSCNRGKPLKVYAFITQEICLTLELLEVINR